MGYTQLTISGKRSEIRLKPRSVLGTFSKAHNGVALNLARSGGKNCGDCPYKDNGCYAERAEIRPDRSQLVAKLVRHENTPPHQLCDAARIELERVAPKVRWFRFSAFGDCPPRITARFADSARKLVALCARHAIPVHWPVQGKAKAARYRARFGDIALIRESVDNYKRWLCAEHACSVVVGEPEDTRVERIVKAKRAARERTARTGRKAYVCPAIAASFKRIGKDKAKCGNCTLCAQDVDIVYPRH